MTSAELLSRSDRCPRAPYYSLRWQKNTVHPTEVLRQAVECGLTDPEDQDHGQRAGDEVMGLAAERTLDTEGSQYECAMHHAALADLITTVLRKGEAWGHPESVPMLGVTWDSGAYVEPSGVRLRRVVLADRWTPDKLQAERHSWYTLGEIAAYGLPMTLTVVLIGQRRDGKHSSPWTKGSLNPIGRQLRIRKRTGETFSAKWTPVWREQADWISRDKWLDAMDADRVMADICFNVEIGVPIPEVTAKIRRLAATKLERILSQKETPEPNPSSCYGMTPCQFASACWTFQEPSERIGFTQVQICASRESAL